MTTSHTSVINVEFFFENNRLANELSKKKIDQDNEAYLKRTALLN